MATRRLSVPAVLVSCLLALSECSPVVVKTGATAKEVAKLTSKTASTAANSTINTTNFIPKKDIDIVETTVTRQGDILDWIEIGSQGNVASPPPFSLAGSADGLTNINIPAEKNIIEPASNTLQRRSRRSGKYGTTIANGSTIVPIPRHKAGVKFLKTPPPTRTTILEQKKKKGSLLNRLLKRGYAGEHWYVTSNFGGVFKGAKGIFSCYKPYVNSQDFSLLQMAVGRTGLNTGIQTVEAGYQFYPAFKNTPRIFTFYTINGYAAQSDNVGGYDQTVKGWVQSSSNYYPGIAVSNYSSYGGAQQELNLQYLMFNGNWWLWIQNEWAGYYPGSLFSAGQPDASKTLANTADQVFFYGEIAQGGDALTNTDMGSGKSADLGFKQSAYIRNMQYAGSNSQWAAYPAQTVDFYDSDSARYNHSFKPAGANNWAQYVYLGGYGAGGTTGA